jgi:hypothetical protein
MGRPRAANILGGSADILRLASGGREVIVGDLERGERLMITTSLTGRLRNTMLRQSHGLLPLFEAVVNSIQSIDSTYDDMDQGRIEVHIIRHGQEAINMRVPGYTPREPITEFNVRDNGAGFHAENMKSFETLDSEYKLSLGGRGVGRLLWLKAFQQVEVTSLFTEDSQLRRRSFRFTASDGVVGLELEDVDHGEPSTEVRLVGYQKYYQQQSPKKGSTIARDLLEHCLWYFVREGGAPKIFVIDNDETFDLQQQFEDYMRDSSKREEVAVGAKKFDIIHLKLKAGAKSVPSLNWCAAHRVVIEENISGKIVGLHASLSDDGGEFTYAGYLTSDFLDEHVRPERTDFDLAETPQTRDESADVQEALVDEEPSRAEIRDAILHRVEEYLSDSLAVARERVREKVEAFVSHQAPRYRPVLRRIDERGLHLDPSVSEKELELELHRQFTDLEAEVLKEGQEVLEETALGHLGDDDLAEEYARRLGKYLAKVEDVKKSDLAAYVSRRKTILDLLAKVIQQNPDGKYCREDLIHNLIMPMGTTSEDDVHRVSNLWIIDERLTFHNYLASDKTLRSMPITGSKSTKEPDLLALQLCDTPVLIAEGNNSPWASLSIIEIKRPMRNDAGPGEQKDPIEQCLRYLKRVRAGDINTAQGRPIPHADKVPGFCYIIADLTPTLVDRCEMFRLIQTDDGMGYFGYHDKFNAYIEVVSFGRLLNVANQRNRAFFDAIGLPVV